MNKCMLMSYRNMLVFKLLTMVCLLFSLLSPSVAYGINDKVKASTINASASLPTTNKDISIGPVENHVSHYDHEGHHHHNGIGMKKNIPLSPVTECNDATCKDHALHSHDKGNSPDQSASVHQNHKCNDKACNDHNHSQENIENLALPKRPTYICQDPNCKDHHHHGHNHEQEEAVTMVNTITVKVKTLKSRAIVASLIAIGLLIFAFVMKRK